MFLALLFFLTQISITGRVADREGHPVAGATVTLVEARQAVTTKADGSFAFAAVPEGTYTLVARRIGYAPVAREVTIDGTVPELTLTLGDTPFRVEPVTVTATRSASQTFLAPMSVSTLTGDRVHREAGISLAKSVSMLPGVRDVSTGLQIGKPMVRGLYGPRVLVTHDGSRLEDYSWSEEDGPSIDSRLAERVEVIRGPASVLYGSDALSGVVNVVPAETPSSPTGEPFTHAGLDAYAATNNIELGSAARLEGARGNLGWRLFGTGRFAGSYHAPAGEVDNTGFLSANVDAAGTYRANNHAFTLRLSHYGGEFRLLEANGPVTPPPGAKDEGPERKLMDDRLQFSGNHLWTNFRLEGKAQLQRHALMEVSDDCVPPPGQTTCTPPPPGKEATAFDLLLNTATIDMLGHLGEGSRAATTIGVSGMYQGNDSRGPIFLVPSATTTNAAAFALEELGLGKYVRVLAGGRVDSRKVDADANTQLALTDDSRSWSAAVGHGGVVVSPNPSLAFVANVGMGWRAPTLFDLYANGPHLAEARYEIGDPSLDVERSVNSEVSVRWNTSRAHGEVTGFQNTIDNFIYVQPTAATINGLQVFRHVAEDARLTGGEVLIEANVTGPLTLRAQHDFVRGEKRADKSPLPLMPAPRTIAGAELRSTHLKFASRAMIGVEVENVATQTRLDPDDFPTEGYTLINLDSEIERALAGRVYRIDLDVRNLGNVEYRDFLSRYKQFAASPGINVVLRVGTDLW
jgi:iron complex outermembrane receptor protein